MTAPKTGELEGARSVSIWHATANRSPQPARPEKRSVYRPRKLPGAHMVLPTSTSMDLAASAGPEGRHRRAPAGLGNVSGNARPPWAPRHRRLSVCVVCMSRASSRSILGRDLALQVCEPCQAPPASRTSQDTVCVTSLTDSQLGPPMSIAP